MATAAVDALPLRVEGAKKNYGKVTALAGVSFDVRPGELIGLLGPNGAGKTTAIRAIAGRVSLDSGSVQLFGRTLAPRDQRPEIGVVPQELAVYPKLTARENLEVFGELSGVTGKTLKTRVDWALDWSDLNDRAKEPTLRFSGGMKRRLNIACSLLHAPKIVLLDEPTVGVDPQSRNAIFSNLEELKRRGKTLVYTTHYMEEAERLCDRIIIVDHGKVIANDTLAAVRRLVPSVNVLQLEIANPGATGWAAQVGDLPGVISAAAENHTLRVEVQDLLETAPVVFAWLRQHGYQCAHVASQRADLETVFLTLTGRSVRNA